MQATPPATKESTIPSRLLTIKQVADLMEVSESTIFSLLRSKKDPIPSIKFLKTRRFQLDKVMWWIEKHEQ